MHFNDYFKQFGDDSVVITHKPDDFAFENFV